MIWEKVEDGEYNEQKTVIEGRSVTIFSDRDGEQWDCVIDGQECFSLEATSKYSARKEAEREAKQ